MIVPGSSIVHWVYLVNLGVVNYDRLLLDSAVYSRALDSADRVMHRHTTETVLGGLFMVPGADILEMPLRDQMILWSSYYDPYHWKGGMVFYSIEPTP